MIRKITIREVVEFYTALPEYGLQGSAYKVGRFYQANIDSIRMMSPEDKVEAIFRIWRHFRGVFTLQKFCMEFHFPLPLAVKYSTDNLLQMVGMDYVPTDKRIERVTTDVELERYYKSAEVAKPTYELALLLSQGKDEVLRRYKKEVLGEVVCEGVLACEGACAVSG